MPNRELDLDASHEQLKLKRELEWRKREISRLRLFKIAVFIESIIILYIAGLLVNKALRVHFSQLNWISALPAILAIFFLFLIFMIWVGLAFFPMMAPKQNPFEYESPRFEISFFKIFVGIQNIIFLFVIGATGFLSEEYSYETPTWWESLSGLLMFIPFYGIWVGLGHFPLRDKPDYLK